MKYLSLLFLLIISCASTNNNDQKKTEISKVVDNWHKAAAEANYNNYFEIMSDDSNFMGTDATENWTKKEFQAYAKPYFDKGKAWNFTAFDRKIFISENGKIAWFDELLTTQMKICRGSGILEQVNGQWKIKHYVLSMTIPNENVDEVVKIKASIEDAFMNNFKN